MELLQPEDWSEALELKAAHPTALPIWGGTDVMVDLNFGRERPEAILDLTRVRALAEWDERDHTVRIGAGVSYTTAIADLKESVRNSLRYFQTATRSRRCTRVRPRSSSPPRAKPVASQSPASSPARSATSSSPTS